MRHPYIHRTQHLYGAQPPNERGRATRQPDRRGRGVQAMIGRDARLRTQASGRLGAPRGCAGFGWLGRTLDSPAPPPHPGFEKVPVRLEHAAPASKRSQTARAGGVDPPGPGTPAAQRLALRCYRSSGGWPARARDWTRGVGGWVCRVRHMTTPTELALCSQTKKRNVPPP